MSNGPTATGQASAPKPLAGKVALITGGSKGIGKATALHLAAQGASVVINYSSDTAAAEAVVQEIGPAQAFAVQADAGDVKDIQRLVDEAVARFGKIDILIPNAGILQMRDLQHTTEEDFDLTFKLNVKGPYFLVQKALPHLAPGSRIVLVSTTLCGASTITPNYALYLTSKGSIEQLTRVLAKELGPKQIAVNAVAPGPTATELFLKGKSEAVIKAIASFSPQNRLAQPDEIAEVISDLATTKWISGQIVRVNGGMA
ncbi:hypothetical protein DV735_g5371, partial [Chaetothyriales sp. CBS 134920]